MVYLGTLYYLLGKHKAVSNDSNLSKLFLGAPDTTSPKLTDSVSVSYAAFLII